MATLGSGYATRPLYDAYRAGLSGQVAQARAGRPLRLSRAGRRRRQRGRGAPARRAGRRLSAHLGDRARAVPQSAGLPLGRGQRPHAAGRDARRAASPRTAAPSNMHSGSVQDLIDAGILFCGTPDQVYQQIVDFTEYCGGMGNLLMMGHAGFLTHEDTVGNLDAVREGGDAAAQGLQAAGAGGGGGVTLASPTGVLDRSGAWSRLPGRRLVSPLGQIRGVERPSGARGFAAAGLLIRHTLARRAASSRRMRASQRLRDAALFEPGPRA